VAEREFEVVKKRRKRANNTYEIKTLEGDETHAYQTIG
jgi:hypothetical protein